MLASASVGGEVGSGWSSQHGCNVLLLLNQSRKCHAQGMSQACVRLPPVNSEDASKR